MPVVDEFDFVIQNDRNGPLFWLIGRSFKKTQESAKDLISAVV